MPEGGQDSSPAPRGFGQWIRLIRMAGLVLVMGVVVAAIVPHFRKAARDLGSHPVHIGYAWVVMSAAAYFGGLTVLSIPFWLTISSLSGSRTWPETASPYLISQVGKYVPGKAMLPFIRCALMRRRGVRVFAVLMGTIYEVLLEMVAAAFVVLAIWQWAPLPLAYQQMVSKYRSVQAIVLLLGLVMGMVLMPRIFVALTSFLSRRRGGEPLPRVHWTVFPGGLAAALVAWMLIGSALLFSVQSVAEQPLGAEALPAAMANAALAILIGFVSMVPGQVLVREAILIEALTPLTHSDLTAIAAAALFRVVTVSVDGLTAGLLYLVKER